MVDALIRLARVDTRESYLLGFWRLVELLAEGRYDAAVAGMLWPGDRPIAPDGFRQVIEGFFGGDDPWSVIIPNERLVGVINDAAEVELPHAGGTCSGEPHRHAHEGWMLCQIPVTNEPERAKEDDVVLMGVATSFRLVPRDDGYVMGFEMFHA